MADAVIRQTALAYHENEPAGKIAIQPIKLVANRYNLALAYSPSVAHTCHAIEGHPANAGADGVNCC